MGHFVEKIEEKMIGELTVEKKLLILIEMHFMQLEMDHNLAIVTQLELRQSNLSIRYKVNEVLKGYLTLVDSVLKEGIKSGVFEEDLDIRIARQLIFGTIDEVVTNWVMKDHRYDLSPIAETIHRMLLKGLSKSSI
jgi:TetR/AcrR family fatty acid metabolism transcriptional regulator